MNLKCKLRIHGDTIAACNPNTNMVTLTCKRCGKSFWHGTLKKYNEIRKKLGRPVFGTDFSN